MSPPKEPKKKPPRGPTLKPSKPPSSRNPGGKQYKMSRAELDPALFKVLVTAARIGASKEDACAEAGIGRTTLYDWLKRGETGDEEFVEFHRAFTKAFNEPKMRALTKLSLAINEGDVRAITWFLEKRYPKEFGHMAQVQITGSIDVNTTVDVSGFDDRSDEEIFHYVRTGVFTDGTKPVAK